MDSDVLASMYAQIVRGVPKEQSQHVTDDESSQMWDTVAAEVEQARAENPQVVFDVPGEIYGPPSMADRELPTTESAEEPEPTEEGPDPESGEEEETDE